MASSKSLRHNHNFLRGLHMALRVWKTMDHEMFFKLAGKGSKDKDR